MWHRKITDFESELDDIDDESWFQSLAEEESLSETVMNLKSTDTQPLTVSETTVSETTPEPTLEEPVIVDEVSEELAQLSQQIRTDYFESMRIIEADYSGYMKSLHSQHQAFDAAERKLRRKAPVDQQ